MLDRGRLVVEGTTDELKRRVGQDRLTLTVPPADVERAVAILSPADVHGESTLGQLSLSLRNPDHLREVLTVLAVEEVPVTDVRVQAPSLDDVFLALTDRTNTAEVAA